MEKVVLAYSGGLDTSIIIPWLKENYGYEVIAMAADLGQGEELEPLREKAMKTGASKIYIEDLREEFLTEFIYPTIKAGAKYEGKYLLGTSFARPLIAKRLVEIAAQEGAVAIAHGATGKGNDQVRFELAVKALNPDLKIIAPWREWKIRSREEAIEYATERNIPVPVTKAKPYSMDRNLWHLSHEGADLEDPWNEAQDDLYMLGVSPEQAPDKPAYLELDFEQGIPVALDGKKMKPIELLTKLNELGGANGIGIISMVENRLVGMKSRGVYETPGGTILYTAHQALEELTLDRMTLHYKEQVALKYAEMVYDGVWYSPLREALDAFVQVTQRNVTGTVRIKLYKGNCTAAGAKAPYSLYNLEFVTFGEDAVYNQKDAEGFINLFGLPLKVRALMEKSSGLKK
ncbi:argininosuccinate synthase [Syntrophobotulus glycolicus DSM 8271]|uniref:Argininosuccinate synthase n=1 Tax=Syntrophobotulus glycolicus (strain DSM 8271 / FlGlyR) TaxID=645991 RepID=F0SY60_SYNGF|nr:argininosuccinate synthase [Syntrophobotulus glycolicus]ADY54810.1 argininosuccinate synthase [Syntrophobotulus glycolicus DSM 8271]